jgi:hypothetical protein
MVQEVPTLGEIIAVVGGYTIAVAALLGFAGKLFHDFLIASLKSSYDTSLQQLKDDNAIRLETIRASLSDNREALSSVLKTSASGYSTPHPRIIEAVSEFWKSEVKMRRAIQPHLFPYAMYSPGKYDLDNEDLREALSGGSLLELMDSFTEPDEVEYLRPLVGETLWYLHELHRTFCHHMMSRVMHFSAKHELLAWDKDERGRDEAIAAVIRATLTTADIEAEKVFFIVPKIFQHLGEPQRVIRAIERKMLAEINEWIFGRKLVALSAEDQSRLMDVQASLAKTVQEGQRFSN